MNSLYMDANSSNIAELVIFSGDPWRVDVLKNYLDNVQHIAFKREFNTYTGTYKGVPITVTSTGIGSPSAAIAMEEMYECGMKVAVRMGTIMSLEENTLGKFIIPVATLRRDGTSATYVEQGYPAVADYDLVTVMDQSVEDFGKEHINGITASMDGFYSQMHDSRFSLEKNKNMQAVYTELKQMGVCGVDMESSCLLTVGRLMKVKSVVVTMVTVLENLKAVLSGKERSDAEDLLCRVVLEGLFRYGHIEKLG